MDRRQTVKTWASAWFAGAIMAAAGAFIVIEGGLFDATATTPHSPLVAWAAHTAFIQSVRRESDAVHAPAAFSPQEVASGSVAYRRNCAVCHGGPGVARAAWVSGLTPTPPFIIDTSRKFTPGQLYWIVDRGVKMTAMPAWRGTEDDREIWDIVAFLEAMPYLSARDYRRMTGAT